MSDSGICYLTEKIPKLKTLELNNKQINKTIIKALIEKALNNSKTYYKIKALNTTENLNFDNTTSKI